MRVKVLQTKTSPIKLLALTLTRTGTVSDAGSAFDRYRIVPLCAISPDVNRDGGRMTVASGIREAFIKGAKQLMQGPPISPGSGEHIVQLSLNPAGFGSLDRISKILITLPPMAHRVSMNPNHCRGLCQRQAAFNSFDHAVHTVW